METETLKRIYNSFIEEYKDTLSKDEIKEIKNINEYFLLRKRIIELYESGNYTEFLETLKVFTEDITTSSNTIEKKLKEYEHDTLNEIVAEAMKYKNDENGRKLEVIISTMRRFVIDSTSFSYESKLYLLNNYFSEMEIIGIDTTDIKKRARTFLHISETLKENIINREKEKIVAAATSSIETKTRQIIEEQSKTDVELANNLIKEDVEAVKEIASGINENERTSLLDEATATLGYKIELTEEQLDDIALAQDEITTEVLIANSIASEISNKNTFLSNIRLFKKISNDDSKIEKETDELIQETQNDIEQSKKVYKESKKKSIDLKNKLKAIREKLNESKKSESIKNIIQDKTKKEIISAIKTLGESIKNKISSKQKNDKKKQKNGQLKRKIASLLGATILLTSQQAQEVKNIVSEVNNTNAIVTPEENINSYEMLLGIDFKESISNILEKLQKTDDKEIKYYIDCIKNLNFTSNTKGKVTDSMLYALGLCASNWDSNCKVFGVNETWQERIQKVINTVHGLKSISTVDRNDVNWRGITYNTDKDLNNMEIELNESYNGQISSLIHEGEHTDQNVLKKWLETRNIIGQMPNQEQIARFLAEGEADFIQGLANTDFLRYGFDSYKDIEGQTFGLILVVGANEYIEFITENEKNETFVDFVIRRFKEQGYTQQKAEDYLIALQNSLIGTLNSYGVSKNIGVISNPTDFSKRAMESYKKELSNFEKNSSDTFVNNYNKLSNIVEEVLRNRLEKAKSNDEIVSALYSLGVYHDHIIGNYTAYIEEKTKSKDSLDVKVTTTVLMNEDIVEDRKEAFNDIYAEMYDACNDGVVKNFELPYNEFVNIFNTSGKATNFIDSVEHQNDVYIWEKANGIDVMRNNIGDVPNLIEFTSFLNEGNQLFPNGIDYNTISGTTNKGITSIYIGLGITIGFDELNSYIKNNDKKENLEELIIRRFKEQGFDDKYTKTYALGFILSLQNSLIGRFDHNINKVQNEIKTGAGIVRANNYKKADNSEANEIFDDYSASILKAMKIKLNKAKTDEEKIEAIKYASIYIDCVAGNSVYYDDDYTIQRNKNRKKDAKNAFDEISKLMFNTYDSITTNDELITYEDFVDQYEATGKATKFYTSLTKNNITTEQDKSSVEKITIQKASEDNTLSKSKLLSDAKSYLNIFIENSLLPKELIYGFLDRYSELMDNGTLSLSESKQILDKIKKGEVSINKTLGKFASIEKNRNKEDNKTSETEQTKGVRR